MIDVRFQPMQTRPAAQPGRPYYIKASFKARTAMDELERELKHLDATDIVIESGHTRQQIRNDGWPRGGTSPSHQDVRLYFNCKHGTLRYECNRFNRWEDNLRAIGLWLQRQRLAIEEWGIGSGGEAYRGFAALPAGNTIAAGEFASAEDAARFICRVEGCEIATAEDVEAVIADPSGSYRAAAKKAHPDAGGSEALMSKLNRAKDYIEKARAGGANR